MSAFGEMHKPAECPNMGWESDVASDFGNWLRRIASDTNAGRVNDTRQTFYALNGLRGVAALAVLLFHAHPFFPSAIAPSGYLAVDLFFILSGFVIAYAYDTRFENGLRPQDFIIARAKRFWPLFALGTILGAGWLILELIVAPPAALSWGELAGAFTAAMFFIPLPTNGDLFPLNIPAWSLLFELVVNAAYALLHRRLSTRILLSILAISAPLMMSMIAFDLFDSQALGLIRAVFGFTLGILLFRKRGSLPTIPAWAGIAVICGPLLLPQSSLLEAFCVFLLFPFGIAILAHAKPSRLDPHYEWIGALSFPLYALHYPILIAALGTSDYLPIPLWLTGCIAIIGALIMSWLAENYFDKPVRQWVKRRASAAYAR